MAGQVIIRLRVKDLEARLGIDRVTLWRWYRSGRFPEPQYLGERRTWLLSDIEAWEQRQLSRSKEERRGAKNLSSAA
jgi:predicted DNA-binding transcriptional regulator AlpA